MGFQSGDIGRDGPVQLGTRFTVGSPHSTAFEPSTTNQAWATLARALAIRLVQLRKR